MDVSNTVGQSVNLGNDQVIRTVGVAVVAAIVKILMSSVLQLCIHSRFGSFQAVSGSLPPKFCMFAIFLDHRYICSSTASVLQF